MDTRHRISSTPIVDPRLVSSAAALGLTLCLALGGCLDLPAGAGYRPGVLDGGADLVPPTAFVVKQASMGQPAGPGRDGLGPASPLWVELSWPVDPATVSEDTVVLVPGTRESVGAAFLADVDHPPLSPARRSQRVPARVLVPASEGLHRLQIVPLHPLDRSQDYLVALSAALRSIDGRSLTRPDGTLGGVTIAFRTGPDGSGPPWLALVSPPPGQTEVPINLQQVLVVASEPVTQLPFGLGLIADDGERVEGMPGAASGCPGIPDGPDASADRCFVLQLLAPLRPDHSYAPAALPGVADRQGNPLAAPAPDQIFTTGSTPDLQAPQLQVSRLVARDRDLVVVADSDEEAILAVTAIPELDTAEESREAAVHREAGPARQFQLVLDGLVPDRVQHLQVTLTDDAGNVTGTELVVRTQPPLPQVAITEVLADPVVSPEPAGEFVELYNYGSTEVDLTGWTLSDNAAGDGASLLSGVLPAGGFGLVVSDHYAGAVAGGTLVIPVGTDVAQRGLSNAGEPLFLVDGGGVTVSTFGNPVPPRPGVSLWRVRPEAPDAPSSWRPSAAGQATPGGPSPGW